MEGFSVTAFCILLATCYMSYKGITQRSYLDRFAFQTDAILVEKDYKRLITSGFVHTGWFHLIFNMVTLYCFCASLEDLLGVPTLFGLYLGSLLAGNLLALYIHRNHGDYSAVGASGAVSGLVFASIALFPGLELRMFFIPVSLPGWIFGFLYVVYSVYGIKSQRDNIGHDAHLGGGIAGLLIAIGLQPSIIFTNYLPILVILIPSILFLYLIVSRPYILLIENPFKKNDDHYTVEDKYNASKKQKEEELDLLLDKINKDGIGSLTKEEKKRLEQFSNR